MTDLVNLICPLVVGVFLGAVFFGGLWWTICTCLETKLPAFWICASLLLRSSITLIGFKLVSFGQLERFLICLLGFIVARIIVTRFIQVQEVRNASYP